MIIKTNGFKMPNGDIHTFIPPSPTENERGGIKAKAKTTEALEVAFDEASERLYAAIPNTDKTLSETGVAADAKTTGDKIKDKLDRNQGIEHYGKSLIVGEDGLVVPGEVQSGGDGIAIINTMSGESPLVIPDSAERVNKRLELGGKTAQVQTTGAQLFDSKLFGTVSNTGGATVTNNGDGTFSVSGNGTLTKIFNVSHEYSKEQTLSMLKAGKLHARASANVFPCPSFVIFSNGQWTELNMDSTTEKTADITEEMLNSEDLKSRFRFFGKIDNAIKSGTVKIMLYQDGNGDYEPYTGGKPSPSPEYPQEIKNSGKWNEETRKYEVDVKITGKNLFDMNKFIDTCNFTKNDGTFIIDKYVERYDCFIPANTILSIEVLKVEDSSGAAALELFYEDGKSMYIGFGQVGVKTFLIQKDVVYIKVLAYRKHEYKYIQLEKGNTATPYEPYKEQTLTLTSDRPITKWDRLVEQGGEIGWLYKSKTATITGKEHYSAPSESYYSGTSTNMYTADFGLFIKGGEYCNRLQRIDGIWDSSNTNNIGFTTNASDQIHIRIYNSLLNVSDNATKEEKVAAFKTYLTKEYENGNPYIVIFQTKDTEFVPLPQSEQNAIRALKTYYPTTTITNDQGCTMELDYVADTKNYIDNKFAQLQKSLINTNTQLL